MRDSMAMSIADILRQPTTIENVHESVYRCYAILRNVKWLLEQNTPHVVILDLLEQMQEGGHQVDMKIGDLHTLDGALKAEEQAQQGA